MNKLALVVVIVAAISGIGYIASQPSIDSSPGVSSDQSPSTTSSAQVASIPDLDLRTHPSEGPADGLRAPVAEIQIDSVPPGAAVVCVPPENKTVEATRPDQVLGKTPLVIARAACPAARVWVRMDVHELTAALAGLPGLQSWVATFQSRLYFGGGLGSDDYFRFDSQVSQSVKSASDTLIAIGPVYALDGQTQRLCALFIPHGLSRSALFPLMPPPGTFPRLAGTWPEILHTHYHLTAEQANTGLEMLTRCGKYEATVADPFVENSGRLLSFTETADGMVSIVTSEIRLFTGLNDNP